MCFNRNMKDEIKMVPFVNGEPIYKEKPFPQDVVDLSPDAIVALQSALGRRDKMGFADKVAVDAAKFVISSGTVKDSDEYKKMLGSFRELIMKSRKKEEIPEQTAEEAQEFSDMSG